MATLETRLARLETQQAATDCLARYFDLCDVPGPLADPDEIGALFTADAVWEGVGPEYEGAFGRAEGRQAVQELVCGFLPPVEHFVRNAHVLSSGRVTAERTSAAGRWLMQQLALYADGTADLRCARITVSFEVTPVRHQPPTVLISHFQTQRLFITPLDPELLQSLFP